MNSYINFKLHVLIFTWNTYIPYIHIIFIHKYIHILLCNYFLTFECHRCVSKQCNNSFQYNVRLSCMLPEVGERGGTTCMNKRVLISMSRFAPHTDLGSPYGIGRLLDTCINLRKVECGYLDVPGDFVSRVQGLVSTTDSKNKKTECWIHTQLGVLLSNDLTEAVQVVIHR